MMGSTSNSDSWSRQLDQVFSWNDGWNDLYNYTMPNGKVVELKRDSLSAPIVAWIFIGISGLILPGLIALLIWRRNMQPIKARSALLMIMSVIAQFLVFLTTSIRLGAGRWRYPCFLYTIVFSILVPSIFLPSIFRMWRLFFIFRISQMKTKLAGYKQQQQQYQQLLKRQSMYVMSGSPIAADLDSKSDLDKKVQQEMADFTDPDLMSYTSQTQLSTMGNDYGYSKKEARSFAIQKFLFSNHFLVLMLLLVIVIHAIIWIITLFVPYSELKNLKDLFAFRFACVSDIPRTIVIGVQIVFYLLIEAVLLAMLYIFKVNDKWGVRLEVTISLVIIAIPFGIGLLLTGLGDYLYVNGERYFPAVNYGLIGMFADLLWSIVWPLVQSFFPKNNRQSSTMNIEEPESLLKAVLDDDAFREIYKQFCAASLVVEPLCFYEDNCEFADPNNNNNKSLVNEAKQIIEKYCRDNSPLLLNLPNKERMLEPIEAKIRDYEKRLKSEAQNKFTISGERWVAPDLFASIRLACINDMHSDTFIRFKLSREYQAYLKEKQKLEKQQEQYGV